MHFEVIRMIRATAIIPGFDNIGPNQGTAHDRVLETKSFPQSGKHKLGSNQKHRIISAIELFAENEWTVLEVTS